MKFLIDVSAGGALVQWMIEEGRKAETLVSDAWGVFGPTWEDCDQFLDRVCNLSCVNGHSPPL